MSTLFNVSPRPEYFSPEHEEFRRTVRAFVEREIAPYVNEWDEAGTFPRELYRKAAAVGIIGLGYPEEYGGTPADQFFSIVSAEEIARAGCGGLQASLGSHGIGMPPVVAHGSEALKRRVLPPVIARREDRRAGHHRARRRLRRGGAEDHRACATATTTWSTARRPSSPRACAPTTSAWRCAPTRPTAAPAACRCC